MRDLRYRVGQRSWLHRRLTGVAVAAVGALVLTFAVTVSSPASASGLALCGNAAPAAHPTRHVLIVLLENKSYSQVVGKPAAPYQSSLVGQCGVATQMFGATHTSAANYLAVSAGQFPAGSPRGCGGVPACRDASPSLYRQLTTAGLGWKAYEEQMPAPCAQQSGGGYKIGHNPPLFYSGLTDCAANDLPVPDLTAQSGALWADLQNQTLPALGWVTPSLVNDGEGSGGLRAADTWLKNFLALVQQSNAYQNGDTTVLVSYDEGTGADSTVGEDCTNKTLDTIGKQESCHVPFFVVNPYVSTSDGTFFDHYSVTRTVEDVFGLPYLAHAGDIQTATLLGHWGLQPATASPSPSPSPSPSASPAASPSPSASPSASPPPTSAPPIQYASNQSVEADLTGWHGTYNRTSAVADVQPAGGAYDGSWALQITNGAAGTAPAGVSNAGPRWIDGTDVVTRAGTPYTGTAWVNPAVSLTAVLMLRECLPGGGSCTVARGSLSLPANRWSQVRAAITARATGDQIQYSLYVPALAAGTSILVDDLSLTSPPTT